MHFPLSLLGILNQPCTLLYCVGSSAQFFPFLGFGYSITVQITYLHTIRCIGEYCLLLAYDPFLPISLAHTVHNNVYTRLC